MVRLYGRSATQNNRSGPAVTAIAIGITVIAVAALGWDALRRWIAVSLAQDKNAENARQLTFLDTSRKTYEQRLEAFKLGLDECFVRLDVIKGENRPTRTELRELDDELRKQHKRVETCERAIEVIAEVAREAKQEITGMQAARLGAPRRMAP